MTPQNPTFITVPTASGNVDVSVPTMAPTTDWAEILGIQAATYAMIVSAKNADLQKVADQMARDYNAAMEAGTEPNRPLPNFPKSYVFVAADQTGTGMPSYEQTGPPIQPSIPLDTFNTALNKAPTPIAGHISMNWASRPGGPAKGSFVTANKDDGMVGNFVTPPIIDPTGTPLDPPHTYQRLTTAVGPGWYQQLD